MKLKEIAAVTEENFDEVEQAFCRFERRHKKELAAWRTAVPIGDLVFFFIALSATYLMADRLELPVFPALRPIVSIWAGSISPRGDIWPLIFTFVLAAVIISSLVHIPVSVVVRLVWPAARSAPLEGSFPEKTEALLSRVSALDGSYPFSWTLLGLLVYPILVLVPCLLYENPLVEGGIILGILSVVLLFVIFAVVYGAAYFLYALIYFELYRTFSGVPALKKALEECVRAHRQAEEKRLEAERKEREEREQAAQRERDRRRGDELYRRATAGGAVDEDLVAEAADLGSRPACLYMGRLLIDTWFAGQYDGSYTQAELLEIGEAAEGYFSVARQEKNFPADLQIEAEFGFLVSCAATETPSTETLDRLRRLRDSGKLSKSQERRCNDVIRALVTELEDRAELEKTLKAALMAAGAVQKAAEERAILDAVARRMSDESRSSSYPAVGSDAWHRMNDDLDAVQDALGGPGWSDGV